MSVHVAKWTRIILAAGAAGIGTSVLAASRTRVAAVRSFPERIAVEPLASPALRPMERAFLEEASASSWRLLRLARVGVSQATSSAVRDFAQQLASDQRQLADAVDALRRKKGTVVDVLEPTGADDAGRQLAGKAGADFDREFVRFIGDLQTQMITTFEQVVGEAKDPEVRDLVGSSLPTLRAQQNSLVELNRVFD